MSESTATKVSFAALLVAVCLMFLAMGNLIFPGMVAMLAASTHGHYHAYDFFHGFVTFFLGMLSVAVIILLMEWLLEPLQ